MTSTSVARQTTITSLEREQAHLYINQAIACFRGAVNGLSAAQWTFSLAGALVHWQTSEHAGSAQAGAGNLASPADAVAMLTNIHAGMRGFLESSPDLRGRIPAKCGAKKAASNCGLRRAPRSKRQPQ